MTIDIHANIFDNFFPTEVDQGPKPIVYRDKPHALDLADNLPPENLAEIQEALDIIELWMPKKSIWAQPSAGPGCKLKRTDREVYADEEAVGPSIYWDPTFVAIINDLQIYPQDPNNDNLARLVAKPNLKDEHVFEDAGKQWFISFWEYQTITVAELLQLEQDEGQINQGRNFFSRDNTYEDVSIVDLRSDSTLILETITWKNNINDLTIVSKMAWPDYKLTR